MSGAPDGPVLHIEPRGRFASRMIQYMVALKFRSLVPESRISNVVLPAWGIDHPPVDSPGPVETAAQIQHVDLAGLAERVRSGEVRRVVYSGFGQRMENFLDVAVYRDVFRSPPLEVPVFDASHVVCPVRSLPVPEGRGFNYPLTPVEFYADLVEQTGLKPVFLGQTAPNAYTHRLRTRFPRAMFLPPGNSMLDFATIRQAKNIVVGVSTFAWLAAWLSEAGRIFLTVSGAFNPMQYPFADLLPLDDPRYRFYLFPIAYAVPLEHHAVAHSRIAPYVRPVPPDTLRRRFQEMPRFDLPGEVMRQAFDAAFYLATYPDVAALVGADNAEGAWAHYMLFGIREQRLPFRLAPAWYATRYPMAAFEIAQGDYTSFAHHYVAVGKARGYRPLPDEGESWWR